VSTSWPVKRLGSVATVSAGNSAPQEKSLFVGGTHTFIRTSDVGQFRVGEISDSADKLNDQGIRGMRMFRKGVTLVPKSGASTFNNHRVITTVESTVSSHLAVVDAHPDVLDDRFVYYYLQTVRAQELIGDQSYPSLNLSHLERVMIPVPPLAEQQRIVAKLDEIDSDLRTLTEHLDAEYLRSAQVRLSAVDSLFDSITAPEKPLAAVCDVFADGDWIESKDQSNTGIRLVQTGNVGDGVFKDRRDKARWIDEGTFSRLKCTEVVPGDILFSRLPDPVGRACRVPDTGDRMITAVDCTIARPSAKVVDPEFMVLFASSSRYFTQVRSMITGTTRDRISRKNLGDVPMPVPTLAEQMQVVSKARDLDGLCAEILTNIERRKAKASELRQSVLAAAFRGEL
jgi:type I restriction enzyme S subunit